MRAIVPSIVATVALALAVSASGQGLRMSSDFLPLEVGNLWRYEVADAGGVTGRIDVQVLEHRIVNGASLYVVSAFPMAAEEIQPGPIGIRFDREQQQYVYTNGSAEAPLFPSGRVVVEVLESDESGIARIVQLAYDARTIVLERGVGVTMVRRAVPDGTGTLTLAAARVGSDVFGDVLPTPGPNTGLRPQPPVDNVVLPSETEPVLEIAAVPDGGGHLLTLTVMNPTDRLMPFEFVTSQSFDFVVTDAAGVEVWRWSRRMFFSQVLRTETIRRSGQWEFEAEWGHEDNELASVDPGAYLLYAILTADPPLQTGPIDIRVE